MSSYIKLKDGVLVDINSEIGKKLVKESAEKSKKRALDIENKAQDVYFDKLALLESEAKAVLAAFKDVKK